MNTEVYIVPYRCLYCAFETDTYPVLESHVKSFHFSPVAAPQVAAPAPEPELAQIAPPGYHSRRLAPDRNNPREIAFAEQWAGAHKHTDILAELICLAPDRRPNASSLCPFGEPMQKVREISIEERRAVATVIQWLGSNVGLSFIEASLARCGYGIKYPLRTAAPVMPPVAEHPDTADKEGA